MTKKEKKIKVDCLDLLVSNEKVVARPNTQYCGSKLIRKKFFSETWLSYLVGWWILVSFVVFI